ncbi:hypothetical protein AB4Z18_02960 [Leifsonia sp. 2TAF2]|uniref:hypothetical protein n=1 Tax=Leifsonia sp. 2TAF2 TaxID=3233009 RepID=UPI003F96A4E3
MSALSVAGSGALDAVNALPDADKKAVVDQVHEANPGLFPNTERAKFWLWLTMLIGVLVLGIISVLAALLLSGSKGDATPAWVLATAALTGVIGLFVKSPTN